MAYSLPSDHKNTGFSMAPFGEQMFCSEDSILL